jgi:putative toxin-antitoxin system antitoxin component (TIGR02293 family)
MTNGIVMEKNKKIPTTPLYKTAHKTTKAEEPEAVFSKTVKLIPSVKNFTYSEFKKIADKTPFTQAEWAAMLMISERTLQRYAKNNGSFAPINAERFVHIGQVLSKAKNVFGSIEAFYEWIHSKPPMLESELSFASLTSFEGIQKVLTQIGRIEHGILS